MSHNLEDNTKMAIFDTPRGRATNVCNILGVDLRNPHNLVAILGPTALNRFHDVIKVYEFPG